MVLHSDLTVCEHHHHDGIDLFPDYNRQIPFGSGTSIVYNYLDYRVKNETETTYQFVVSTDERYLLGELRAYRPNMYKYHIEAENEFFSIEDDGVYRNGKIYRTAVDMRSGVTIEKKLLKTNHAKVMYDTDGLELIDRRN